MGAAVEVVDDFLSAAECAVLLAGADGEDWRDSLSGRPDGSSARDPGGGRNSVSLGVAGLPEPAGDLIRTIEARLVAGFGARADHLEPWQMSRYQRGGFFDYHLDCGAYGGHPAGERARTVLIVLEAPACGGATHFRALGMTVRPLPGRLIVWCNLLPSGRCDHAMIHAGRPVWQGRKTILTTWEHERPFAAGPGS